jgi:hypothetical protein
MKPPALEAGVFCCLGFVRRPDVLKQSDGSVEFIDERRKKHPVCFEILGAPFLRSEYPFEVVRALAQIVDSNRHGSVGEGIDLYKTRFSLHD